MTSGSRKGRMPALFVGHGSPMNAIEDNEFRSGWTRAAEALPRPRAVLCVSAHWETPGAAITAADRPETIHDFYGFPRALFEVRYPAPGDPALARATAERLRGAGVGLDPARGLDHGCWSVLLAMYPRADVPVLQLGLDTRRSPAEHYALARELAPLREEGVLVLASGNIVHNLRLADWNRPGGYDWAARFDDAVKARILVRDHGALVRYEVLGADARLAVPTAEHYLPLLYALALQDDHDEVSFFNDQTVHGSISMTCVQVG